MTAGSVMVNGPSHVPSICMLSTLKGTSSSAHTSHTARGCNTVISTCSCKPHRCNKLDLIHSSSQVHLGAFQQLGQQLTHVQLALVRSGATGSQDSRACNKKARANNGSSTQQACNNSHSLPHPTNSSDHHQIGRRMQLMVIVPYIYGRQQERLQRACHKYAPCTQSRAAAWDVPWKTAAPAAAPLVRHTHSAPWPA